MKKLLSKIVLVSLILAWSLPTLYAVAYPAQTVVTTTGSTVLSPVSRSLSFDGAITTSISVPYSSSLSFPTGNEPICMGGWFKASTSTVIGILGQQTEIIIRTKVGRTVELILNSFATNDRVSTTNTYTVGTWNFVFARYDGSNMFISLNGLSENSLTPTGTYGGSTTNWSLGASGSAGERFVGNLKGLFVKKGTCTAQDGINAYRGSYPSGLSGRWDFNSPSGTIAYDTSGNNNHGTITGATISTDTPPNGFAGTPLQTATVGGVDRSLAFDGTASRKAAVPSSATLTITGNLTYSFWIKSPATQTYANPRPMQKDRNYYVYKNGAGDPALLYRIFDGTNIGGATINDVFDNKWHQITVVHDWTNFKMYGYKDGVKVSEDSDISNVSSTLAVSGTELSIGYSGVANNHYLDGKIKDIRIWNRLLTGSEVSNLYKKIIPRNNLIEELNTNENAGSILNDTSNTGNTGTLYNGIFSPDVPN